MMKYRTKKKVFGESGQSLLEVVISIIIVSLIVVGLARVAVLSLRSNDYAKNKNYSLTLAQSTYEEIRQEKESVDWSLFYSNHSGNPTVIDEVGSFSRTINYLVDPADSDKLGVEIIISWQDSAGVHSSSVSGRLTRWR